MPKSVGIPTFISRINTSSENYKARTIFIFHHFTFYKEQLKFDAQLKFYNLRACLQNLQPGKIDISMHRYYVDQLEY